MDRPTYLALVALVALTGCPDDDPTPADESSSTSGATDGSGSTTAVDGMDETADDTASTGETDTEGTTTTGEVEVEGTRFLVREPFEGGELSELMLYEYADGEILGPLSLTPDLPPGGGLSRLEVFDEGRVLVYCVTDPALDAGPCSVVDASARPPGPPQPIEGGSIAAGSIVTELLWVDAIDALVLRTVDPDGVEPRAIHVATFTGGVLQPPEVVVSEGAGESLLAGTAIRPDGARLGYGMGLDAGPGNGFVVPLDVPDPGATVMVSDVVNPAWRASAPSFVSGHDAVTYTVDDSAPGPTEDSMWWVDLSGAVPGAPIRIDDPLAFEQEVRRPAVAPDGHALIYWAGASLAGDLLFVDLSTGAPQPPVLVSTLGPQQVYIRDSYWSPDSRWIAYQGAHEAADTYDLYLSYAPGSVPGDPVRASGGVVLGSDIEWWAFDASSTWLYYVASEDAADGLQLFRVAIDGAAPGAPQRISGDDGLVNGDIEWSHDGSMMTYTAGTSPREMFLVELGGEEPGVPIRINAPLAEGVDVRFFGRFTQDDSAVIYAETGPSLDAPSPFFLVDLASLEVLPVTADGMSATPIAD